jgi:formylglycine-generating enzyme required for sulfatase activity
MCLCLFGEDTELVSMPGTKTGSIKIISQYGGNLYLDGEFYQSLLTGSSATWQNISSGIHSVKLVNSKIDDTRKVRVSPGETCTVDFNEPAEDIPDEILRDKPREEKPKSEISTQPEPPRIPPIKNNPEQGMGSLQIKSFISGDVYLGGNYIGTVTEGKSKKFSSLSAGEYTMELLHRFYGVRMDLRIYNKRDNSITISASEGVPYKRGMVYLAGGGFFMGTQFLDRNEQERPRHDVELSPFMISFTEVTQNLWNEVMDFNPSARKGDALPVTNVSWYDCLEFCNALSRKDGLEPCYVIDKSFPDKDNLSDLDTLRYSVSCRWDANGYRLPTEAEWEFASRSGDSMNKLQFSGSNDVGKVAWYGENSSNRVREVATKDSNEMGLFDMSGNVYEWCWDYWGLYNREAQSNPEGAVSGTYRVARGGSWMSEADACTSTARSGFAPHSSSKELGFRIVRKARAD